MSSDFLQAIEQAILNTIRERIEILTEKELAEANERIRKGIMEQIGGIATSITKFVTFENYGTELRITVYDKRKPDGS